MSMLTRFKDIMSSNINAMFDKMEDPSKMIDQHLRSLNGDLGNVKAETSSIMAEEKRSKRALDECESDLNKMHNYAIKALEAGNEDDARKFLEEKGALAVKVGGLKASYELALANANQMKDMHNKLVSDIKALESRKDMIKGKLAVAKTQEKMNKIGSSINKSGNSMAAFDRIEQKANKALDQANAMAELNKGSQTDMSSLTSKYSGGGSSVDGELAALKASMFGNNADEAATGATSTDDELEALKASLNDK